MDRLGAKPVAIQLPIGAESQFKGIIDLVRMKAVVWDEETLGAKYSDTDIPADLLDQATEKLYSFPEDLALARTPDLQGLGGPSGTGSETPLKPNCLDELLRNQ